MSYHTNFAAREHQNEPHLYSRTPYHAQASDLSIPLEAMTAQPDHLRYEPTDTLLSSGSTAHTTFPTARSMDRKPSFFRPSTWLYEILSVLLAVMILAAIVAILAYYNEKPSPVVGGITLNTVVAFAATLFRLCLMVPVTNCICQLTWIRLASGYRPLKVVSDIDMASRGPLGSTFVLSKLAHGPLVCIGAGVVVIGIIIGPFVQQSVTFYSASVPSAANAQLEAYASAAFTYDGQVQDDTMAHSVDHIPSNLKAAMNAGLYSSGITSLPYPPFFCSSGNCTWSPFPTLAISAQCFNESERYQMNCSNPAWQPLEGYGVSNRTRACALEPKDPQYRHEHLVSPYKVFNSSGVYPLSNALYDPRVDRYSNLSFDYGFLGSPILTNNSLDSGFALFQWELARGLTWIFSNESYEPSITSSSTFEAGICIFDLEMRVINARVQNGIYSERTIRSTTEIKSASTEYLPDDKMIFTYTPSCQDVGQAEPCSLEGMKTVELSIPFLEYYYLIAAIGNGFPSGNLTTSIERGLWSNDNAYLQVAELLYRSPNITKTMQTIAYYLTFALRANDTILAQQNDPQNKTVTSQNYVAPSHRINGTVYVQAVHLRVRWGWLTLPAALALIVAGLLFETIRLSQSDRIGIWKNNPLALLLNTEWRPEREGMGAATSAEIQKAGQTLEARVVQEGSEGEKMKRMVIVREKIGE